MVMIGYPFETVLHRLNPFAELFGPVQNAATSFFLKRDGLMLAFRSPFLEPQWRDAL